MSDRDVNSDLRSDGMLIRRDFIKLSGLSVGALSANALDAMAGPFEPEDFKDLVPSDKKLRPEWVKELKSRGAPQVFRGKELKFIGMPVGGIACGQLYLGGDGKLWYWGIFKSATSTDYQNQAWAGHKYRYPIGPKDKGEYPAWPDDPVVHGVCIRIHDGEKTIVRTLDRQGFPDVSFRGEYPIGKVTYRDPALPVEVRLEAFSPFIPLNVADSSLPCTILSYEITNRSNRRISVDIAGWLENAVCRYGNHGLNLIRRNSAMRHGDRATLTCYAVAGPAEEPRPDILVADFEASTYGNWKVEGTAFGSGSIERKAVPAYQGELGGEGSRVVNSHSSAPGSSVEEKDRATGKLTSPTFTVERKFLRFYIGGGRNIEHVGLRMLVDGNVVRKGAGRDDNRMRLEVFDVSAFEGKQAFIEVYDQATGGWGNIGVDQIVQTDAPAARKPEDVPGYGSMTLSVIGSSKRISFVADVAEEPRPERVLSSLREETTVADNQPAAKLVGAVGQSIDLAPGKETTVNFLLTWWFPYYGEVSGEMAALGMKRPVRHYATRFISADSVSDYVTRNYKRLSQLTRLWNKTWYESTLPYWFLDRTFIPIDTLATQTLHRFENGRWWGWEGVDCCPGTCQHVWHYAQAMARIFPEIERDFRERVDFGLAWHPDGSMEFRGENDRHVAHDGFCGTILRAYREHQMSKDASFLKRIWPRVKKSIEFILDQDRDKDGLLEGEQMNTLDAAWFGPMAWISSVFLACLAAGEAMATKMKDAPFAQRCSERLEVGRSQLVQKLYNGEYFVHIPPDFNHTNTNRGCHIDQLLGQSLELQVGLPRIAPKKESVSALRALYKYNFTPDVGAYRSKFKAIQGGRWYAMPGEAGLLMCTWPKGGAENASGGGNGNFVAYFNECMSGFEYQAAAHMVWEGLVTEGLAVTRAIHDRYHPSKRNPYNEVECSDHYSRAMAAYGVFLAACGFEYHGPKGHIGFAPRISPDNFKAPFVAAEGWGTYSQKRTKAGLTAEIAVKHGRLRLLSVSIPGSNRSVSAALNGRPLNCSRQSISDRSTILFDKEMTILPGQSLVITSK